MKPVQRLGRKAKQPSSKRLFLLSLVAGTTILGALVLALRWGGAAQVTSGLAGLPSAGPFTTWGLPVVRVLAQTAAVVTVGLLVTAAFFVPGAQRLVSPQGYRLLRIASWSAFSWGVLAFLQAVFTLSDLLATSASEIMFSARLWHFVTNIAQGQALGFQVLLALVTAVACRVVLSRNGAALTSVVAVIAVLPPAFTGHSASAGDHQIAVTSLVFHIAGATLWMGGLVALFVLRNSEVLSGVVGRYSRLALGCFIAVGISGIANAAVRLDSFNQLWQTNYGQLLLVKTIALVVVGFVGAAHRVRAISGLQAGGPALFWRLAIGEVIVFAATLGVAVALSRTPPPAPEQATTSDLVSALAGFPMPMPATVGRMLGGVLPDMFFLALMVVGVIAYLAGVRRLHQAGNHWPVGRTISWIFGMLLLGAATNLGIARYAYVLFSAHMAQHMVLSMLVPIFLVLGAPVTLALRAFRPAPDKTVRGPREWLLIAIHARFTRVITHPVFVVPLFIASLYGLYFSSLFEMAMRSHLGHLLMLTHFVAVGYLFFWMIIGIDPGRYPFSHPVRILAHFVTVAFHAFFGVVLMQAEQILAKDWFAPLHPSWAGSLASDQFLGAGIAWAFSEAPSVVVFAALIVQWVRADEREQRRVDRAADRAERRAARRNVAMASSATETPAGKGVIEQDHSENHDPDDAHAQYNAFLRQLHEQDRGK